jgi:putative endonuclease
VPTAPLQFSANVTAGGGVRVSTTIQGHRAEAAAAHYLVQRGFQILEQNWRTRRCEIDIVARKKKCIYFTEVKFRAKHDWGDGLAYITERKLAQMRFAAELWVAQHNWRGDQALLAISVGPSGEIERVISDL